MGKELEKVCLTLDKLTIDSLTLMQQTIQLKVSIENSMSEGEMHLAKSRYIMGHHKVSSMQLPTENSPDIDPSVVVNRESTQLPEGNMFDLECRTESNSENLNIVNPLKWFGVLVPQNLHQAQVKFRQALGWAAQCAGMQVRLQENCNTIAQLKALKSKLLKAEE